MQSVGRGAWLCSPECPINNSHSSDNRIWFLNVLTYSEEQFFFSFQKLWLWWEIEMSGDIGSTVSTGIFRNYRFMGCLGGVWFCHCASVLDAVAGCAGRSLAAHLCVLGIFCEHASTELLKG